MSDGSAPGAAPSLPAGPFLVFDLEPGAVAEPEGTRDPQRFALDVECVHQVTEVGPPVPVPLAPPAVEGVLNHHGRILTVIDPAPLLGLPAQADPVVHLVVLRRREGGAAHLGLKVARTRAILPRARLEPVDLPPGPAIRCVARAGGALIHVVSHAELLLALGAAFAVPGRRVDAPVRDGASENTSAASAERT